jgi:hypothetical protein
MLKRKWILLVVASVVGLMLASGIAYADGPKMRSEVKTAGKTQVEFLTPEGASLVGDNQVAVQLKDTATGQPIVRPSVRAELVMDGGGQAMQGMHHGADMSVQKPIVVELKADPQEPGKYTGTLNFTDPGSWNARIVAGPSALQDAVSFTVRVDKKTNGPNWLVIGGFLGLVVVGIALVFVLRSRAASPAATTDAA